MTQNNNSAHLDPLDFSNVSDSELFGKLAFAYYEISVNLEIHKRFPDRSITTPHYYAKNPENSKIFSALVTEAQKRLTDNNIPLKNSISAPYYTNLDKNNTLSQQGKESLNDEQKVFLFWRLCPVFLMEKTEKKIISILFLNSGKNLLKKPTFKERLKNFGRKVKKSIIKFIQSEAKDWERRVKNNI